MSNDRILLVRSYLSSLPARINNEEKTQALTYFAEGVTKNGDIGIITRNHEYEDCDVGAIIGNAFGANPMKVTLPHYKVRKMVIDTQTQKNRYWLSIDSNVFIYKNKDNPKKYLRYSFNGIFPKTGIYCNTNPSDENWNNIRRDYNMDLKSWRPNGNHILIALQRPMGWSMRGVNLETWLESTFSTIRNYSDRPIVIRWHPGDWKTYPTYDHILRKYNAVVSPQSRHILEDLKNCWALVCHNSTPSSVAVIEGIPVFITDEPEYCQAGDVANRDFSRIEKPYIFDRSEWIKKLAQCHWSFEDVRSGRCWAHMRNWVNSSPSGSM